MTCLRICSASEIKSLDQKSMESYGMSVQILMEHAGMRAFEVLMEWKPDAGKKNEVIVLAGKGNNAGDAFVVARWLYLHGRKVRVFYLSDHYVGAVKENFEILEKLQVRHNYVEKIDILKQYFQKKTTDTVVVDGLLGTGLKGKVQGLLSQVLEFVRECSPPVLALDIPSGIDADCGRVCAIALPADRTVSFGFPKRGHFLNEGLRYRGVLVHGDIGFPRVFLKEGNIFVFGREKAQALLPKRCVLGHKHHFGHVLVIGGSEGKEGAAALCALGAYRAGAGLVSVATWEEHFQALNQQLPKEVMGMSVPKAETQWDELISSLGRFQSIVLGPGLGRTEQAKKLCKKVLEAFSGPVVCDADAVTVLSSEEGFLEKIRNRKIPILWTPHIGEMATFLGIEKAEVERDPIGSVQKAVQKSFGVVVLKGALTWMSSLDEKIWLYAHPNDGLATGGTGDVLAGILGSFCAQGISVLSAAQSGVWVHQRAGQLAALDQSTASMMASDLLSHLGQVFLECREQKSKKNDFSDITFTKEVDLF